MFSYRRIIALILLLAATSPVVADSREEITTALDYYAEMWNTGDIDGLSGYYHQDFVLITPQGPIAYGQRVEDLKELIGDEDDDRGVLKYSDLTVKPLGDKHAVAYGLLELKFKDGSEISDWFSTTYVKTPFGWKALLSFN